MKKLRLLLEEAEQEKKEKKPAPEEADPNAEVPEEEPEAPKLDPAETASNNLEYDKLKKYVAKTLEDSPAMDDAIMMLVKTIGDAVDKEPTKIGKKNDVLYYMNLLRRKIYNSNLGQ